MGVGGLNHPLGTPLKQAICFADLALKLTCLTSTRFPQYSFFLLTLVSFYMSLKALCISRFFFFFVLLLAIE